MTYGQLPRRPLAGQVLRLAGQYYRVIAAYQAGTADLQLLHEFPCPGAWTHPRMTGVACLRETGQYYRMTGLGWA